MTTSWSTSVAVAKGQAECLILHEEGVNHPTAHHRDDRHLVIKIPGQLRWSRVGERVRDPARFRVIEIDHVASQTFTEPRRISEGSFQIMATQILRGRTVLEFTVRAQP